MNRTRTKNTKDNFQHHDLSAQSLCDSKLSFVSYTDAMGAKVYAEHQYKDTNLKVYRCQQCQLYHLASDHQD